MSAERAVVIVVDDSRLCTCFLVELEECVAGGALRNLDAGVIRLGTPSAAPFVGAHDWPAELDGVPYVALYRRGLRVEGFVAFTAGSLLTRLERLASVPAVARASIVPASRRRADAA